MKKVIFYLALLLPVTAFVPASTLTTRVSILHSATTTTLPEGLTKTVQRPGTGPAVAPGDICTVKYACYHNNQIPFSKASSQKVVLDGSYIKGFEMAIQSMTVGESSRFTVAPELGYGTRGVPNLIGPSEIIQMDIELLGASSIKDNIDFDDIASADTTPKTAADIAKAYELRQQLKADAVELEGLEAWIAKAKTFYFYGLFEGETGERPPWFLRPSITFPIAFAIVGAAFYVSFVGGAISERGIQKTDELDEIILSMNVIAAAVLGLHA